MKVIFTTLFFCFISITAQDVAIIVHPSNTLTSVDKKLIKGVFLGRITKWDDGTPITPIDQHRRSDVREIFSNEVLDMKVKKVLKYWIKQMVRGKAQPPKMTEEEEAIISYVKNTPSAIAYIDFKHVTKDVKVLYVVKTN